MLIEGHSSDIELLELLCAGVGGVTQNKYAAIPVRGERLHTVPAEERVDGQGVSPPLGKSRLRICGCRGGDITPFGIEEHGEAGPVNVVDQLSQLFQTLNAARLIEGDVRLVQACGFVCRINDPSAECEELFSLDSLQGRIDSHAEERALRASGELPEKPALNVRGCLR